MLELFRGAKTAAHSKHICDLHNNTKVENKQRNLSWCSIITVICALQCKKEMPVSPLPLNPNLG
jgi:hypothetical protein